MEDGGCTLTLQKVSNSNIIKAMAKITMYYSPTELKRLYNRLGPKIGVKLRKLTKFASSTLYYLFISLLFGEKKSSLFEVTTFFPNYCMLLFHSYLVQ